jgi:hypothetical protein
MWTGDKCAMPSLQLRDVIHATFELVILSFKLGSGDKISLTKGDLVSRKI